MENKVFRRLQSNHIFLLSVLCLPLILPPEVAEVPGAEVVQCYARRHFRAPVVRPDRELIRFRKIFLLPGEEQEVKFTVNRKELAFYGENMELIDGDVQFRFIVGNSSRSEAGSILYAF